MLQNCNLGVGAKETSFPVFHNGMAISAVEIFKGCNIRVKGKEKEALAIYI